MKEAVDEDGGQQMEVSMGRVGASRCGEREEVRVSERGLGTGWTVRGGWMGGQGAFSRRRMAARRRANK